MPLGGYDFDTGKPQPDEIRKEASTFHLGISRSADLGILIGSPVTISILSIFAFAGLLLALVCGSWVSTPQWDQWDYEGQTLLHYFDHSLSWRFLLSQHNESRLFVPRLVTLLYAPISGWDIRVEVGLTLLCVLLTALGVTLLILRSSRLSPNQQSCCIIAANAVLFWCSQWEVLLFGAYYFVIPGMTLIWALVIAGYRWQYAYKVAAWIVLSLLATLSYVNGIMMWFLLLPAVLIEGQRALISAPKRWYLEAAYCFVGGFTLFVYFRTYKHPGGHPALNTTLADPSRMVTYYLCWLGAPFGHVGQSQQVAETVGAIFLVLFLSVAAYLCWVYRKDIAGSAIYEWITIGGYVILTGVSITAGRSGFGVEQAFASRYQTFSLLLPAVLPPLVFLAINAGFGVDTYRSLRVTFGVAFLAGGAAVLLLLNYQPESLDLKAYGQQRSKAQVAIEFIKVIPDNSALKVAYPVPANMLRICQILTPYQLPTIIIGAEQIAASARAMSLTGNISNGALSAVSDLGNGTLSVQGWAVLKGRDKPANAVLIEWQGLNGAIKPVAALAVGSPSPDAARTGADSSLLYSGFSDVISKANIPGVGLLSAWAVDNVNETAYQVANTKSVMP